MAEGNTDDAIVQGCRRVFFRERSFQKRKVAPTCADVALGERFDEGRLWDAQQPCSGAQRRPRDDVRRVVAAAARVLVLQLHVAQPQDGRQQREHLVLQRTRRVMSRWQQ